LIRFLFSAIEVMGAEASLDLFFFADLQGYGVGRLWNLSGEFFIGGPKPASLPRPQIPWSTGDPRPGVQPPLEALFNLALELAMASSPSGSSSQALRWPAQLSSRQYGEHIELIPL
jgi:hypothetical protein